MNVILGELPKRHLEGGRAQYVPLVVLRIEGLVNDRSLRIPTMSIGRSGGMPITIPGDVDNALGAKRRR
jgi:hypothetical protein